MDKLKSTLAYTAAALTVAAAVFAPVVAFRLITGAVAAAGLHIDSVYTGGKPARVIDRGAYRIVVYEPVRGTAPLSRATPFVQVAWRPAAALPESVNEPIDLDGDGRPDAMISFAVPIVASAPLRVDVRPLDPRVPAMHGVGKDSFSRLIARTGDTILVRVPVQFR